ncbi:MAG: hypothetical protein GX594_15635 [Pirellulaceae bacterium]|nr:hypothetical protein [Pirellulaceae bacterium]
MTTDLQTRWHVSIHESGHLVAGLLLAADPTEKAGAIIESRAGDGCAPIPKSLDHFDRMIAVAAGLAAAELFWHELPPPLPTVAADVSALPVYPPMPLTEREKAEPPKVADSDAIVLARGCIENCERHPWRWIQNYTTFTTQARLLLLDNRTKVLAVAREVFRDGVWTGNRNDLLNFNAPTDSPPVETHK